jgi:hypothetical protein
MKRVSLFLGAALLLTTVACHSSQLRIQADPPGPNERLTGIADGHSGGFMLMGFIPINQNHRFERAYTSALQKSGSTRLADVIVSERWFWTPAGNGFIFHVQGTGVAPALK